MYVSIDQKNIKGLKTRLSNIISHIFHREKDLQRDHFFSSCLLVIFFLQLTGALLCIGDYTKSDEKTSSYFEGTARAFLVDPILNYFEIKGLSLLIMILYLLLNLLFLYFLIDLSTCSTRDSDNQKRGKIDRIGFISSYLEIY